MPDLIPAELMPAAPFDPDLIPPDAADAQDLEPLPPEIERWEPTTQDEAEWAMRLLAAYQAEAAAISDQAALWREPIDVWEAAELRRIVRKAEFFTGHLERFALAWRQRTDRATLALPSGKVTTTKQPRRIYVGDEAAVWEWLAARDAVDDLEARDAFTKQELSLSGIQAACQIEDRPLAVDVYRSCGCIYRAPGWDDRTPGVCPECATGSEVTQVLVVDSELVATFRGDRVPGLDVTPERIKPKVKPA